MELKTFKSKYKEYTYYFKGNEEVKHGLCRVWYSNGQLEYEYYSKEEKMKRKIESKSWRLAMGYSEEEREQGCGTCRYYVEDKDWIESCSHPMDPWMNEGKCRCWESMQEYNVTNRSW